MDRELHDTKNQSMLHGITALLKDTQRLLQRQADDADLGRIRRRLLEGVKRGVDTTAYVLDDDDLL